MLTPRRLPGAGRWSQARHGEHLDGCWESHTRVGGRDSRSPVLTAPSGSARDSEVLSPPDRSCLGAVTVTLQVTGDEIGPRASGWRAWDLDGLNHYCRVAAQPEITFLQGCWKEKKWESR